MLYRQSERLSRTIIDAVEVQVQWVLYSHNHRRYNIRPSSELTVRKYVAELGRLADFNPKKKSTGAGHQENVAEDKELKNVVRAYEAVNQGSLINNKCLIKSVQLIDRCQ